MEQFFGGILPLSAFAVFICGTSLRIAAWLRRPVPFQLTLFPEPRGKAGKLAAVAGEFLFCGTLFRENRLLWLWVWLFHVSLAMILAGHLLGISFLRGQFTLIGATPETSSLLSTYLGAAMGMFMIISLTALLCRRFFTPDVRKLTEPLAWVDLLLLLTVALSGLAMYLPGYHTDLPSVRAYMAGLLTLRPGPLPTSPLFKIHFSLVNLLLLYYPFSQLLHGAGFFVNRAMQLEAAPIFPTPPGKPTRSRFAEPKEQNNMAESPGQSGDRGESQP
ncbi:MAG: respiratory nitrate reductase subunit gamma [Desulfuromonadales bacterium]|nr:respiratory nitrate reductase subunit gamma [Desulfuromonadales bacterium]